MPSDDPTVLNLGYRLRVVGTDPGTINIRVHGELLDSTGSNGRTSFTTSVNDHPLQPGSGSVGPSGGTLQTISLPRQTNLRPGTWRVTAEPNETVRTQVQCEFPIPPGVLRIIGWDNQEGQKICS